MTKQIPLSQGKFALVDDGDFLYLNRWKWCVRIDPGTSYAVRQEQWPSKKMIRMHRIIMNPSDGMEVDHINGNGLDNRRENLRVCTRAQNRRNRLKYSTNKSGYKGVSKHKKVWVAHICVDNHHKYLGLFDTPESAAYAYDEAAKKYFGEFANVNFK